MILHEILLRLFLNQINLKNKRAYRFIFNEKVLPDWNWGHYIKVLEELQALGAVDEHWTEDPVVCEEISRELQMIAEDNSYV